MKLYDVVELQYDLLEDNLRKGAQGTIIEVFEKPLLAYEVEFCDLEGNTLHTKDRQSILELALPPEALKVIWSFSE